eukprot:TRINITY_DN1614_c0_g1_i4.p1 TRINITY_DN1614_c0_g1~~TRINITY_DN1614_c0_g1_i4.p1  ORF type:complete len:508 (+),score=143.85 TRINITY_DN1614_c0_g1_i4:126-1526(+)
MASSSSSSSSSGSDSTHFDYFVIGGGSGGIASARRAASYGARTAVVENVVIGGTCVNRGCVPKKVMWNCADIAEKLHAAPAYGFELKEGFQFNWKKIKTSRDAYIQRLNGIYHNNLKNSGVTELAGHAKFTGPNKIDVDGKEYTAKHIMIAVGGKPIYPDIPGAEHGISSDGFFELEELPKRVAVVGAGYIAVELAGVLNSLGSDVSLIIRHKEFLRTFDPMLRQMLAEEMKTSGVKILTETKTSKVRKDDKGELYIATEDGKGELGPFDVLLWAVGRKPNTEHLGLKEAGIKVKEDSGHIVVDEWQNTNVEGVYALGDVCGNKELTPVAIAAGRRLSDRLFGGKPQSKLDYSFVPSVIFSHPTIGSIGYNEDEAKEHFGADKIKVYATKFVNMYYSPLERKVKTGMKLVCLLPEERVIGLHCIGEGSDEMLQGFSVAVKMGATKKDFDNTVAIHPTASEEFVTMT